MEVAAKVVVAVGALIACVGSSSATDADFIGKAITNKPFDLAVSMTMKLAYCDLSEQDHYTTEQLREAALDVASEQLRHKRSEVKRLVSEIASGAAHKQVTEGTSRASCAYHKAWLMGLD